MNNYMFSGFAFVFFYQAVIFFIALAREKSKPLLWFAGFALSSAVYSLTFIPLYLSDVDNFLPYIEWAFLIGFITYITYMICLNIYIGKPSKFRLILIFLSVLTATLYLFILVAGNINGESLLILQREQAVSNRYIPFEFTKHYQLSAILNFCHGFARILVIAFLISVLIKREMRQDRYIQAGMIMSLLFMAHNSYTVNFNLEFYLPLLPFMNFIELSRFNWLVGRRKEQLLGQIQERLESYDEGMKKHLKLKQIGENTASIIHDISNPAQIIGGELDLIEIYAQKHNDERLMAELRKAKNANSRLTDLLDQSRRENLSGKATEKIDLPGVIKNALALTQHRLSLNSIDVSQELEQTSHVVGNSVKLSQVLINLINNACDEIVDKEDPWMKITLEQTQYEIRLSVSNSGEKISAELHDKIMSPFFTTKSDNGGSGMGLHICKLHLEEMGAKLIINPESKYTQFDILFNLNAQSQPS